MELSAVNLTKRYGSKTAVNLHLQYIINERRFFV